MNYYNYFTEIEEHFVKRRGKHLLISPMDWGLIAAWRDAGVPLNVAIRGIDIALDKFFARQKPGHARINSLCYCHDSVMAEYATHLESHIGESSSEMQPEADSSQDGHGIAEVLEYLSQRIAEIKTFSATHYPQSTPEGTARVLARLEEMSSNVESAGRLDSEKLEKDLAIIDDLLVPELQAAVTAEQMTDLEKEAKKELKIYKKRLPKETYEKIRGNFMREKFHRLFRIGELSIFRL